jgi:hypothetical protein
MVVMLTVHGLPATYPEVFVVACQLHKSAYRVGEMVQGLGRGVNTPERGYMDVGLT